MFQLTDTQRLLTGSLSMCRIPLLTLALLVVWPVSSQAIDVVVRRTDQRDGGRITSSSKTQVTVTKQVGGDTVVPVNEIAYIEWDGAPSIMALGRSSLNAGQLDIAQKQLEQAASESAGSSNNGMRGDIDFLLARVAASRGLASPAAAKEACDKLKAFLASNRDHYRLFDAQLLLGDLSLIADDESSAETAYTTVGTAPWPDYQMAAQIGLGNVLLAKNNIDGAKREFDAVVAKPADTPAQKSRRIAALLGQARCLQAKDDFQSAVTIYEQVIDESTAADSRIQAEAYVRQGDCLVAIGGNPKAAIMAYLHVDVIPALSKEADLHAESLYHLARLWKQVGQDDRAREAAETLQSQYPASEWTTKLGS